jgi:hypothetical protein
MRYYIGYHNEEKMGALDTSLRHPRVKTKKPVLGLEGSTVWLIAGVGSSPKSYYVASRFIIEKCEPDKYLGEKLPNQVSGEGKMLGRSVPLDRSDLLPELKRQSANFVSGFCQISDPNTIAGLKAIT